MANQPQNPKQPARKPGSRLGDTLFWVAVLVLGSVALVLVLLAVWNGWQSATAAPTVVVFSREQTPQVTQSASSPTPEALDLELERAAPENNDPNPVATPPQIPGGLTPEAEAVGSGLTSLQDDFSNPQGGWSTRTTESSRRGYEGGAYFIETEAMDVYALSFVPVEFLPAVFRFEAAVVTPGSGGTFGLLCQYVDENSFYLVEFDALRGELALGKRSAGEYQPLSEPEWQPVQGFDTTPGAINRFSISCSPQRLQVSVNGGESRSAEVLNPLIGGRRAALFTAGSAEIAAGGYRVYWDNFFAQADIP